MIGFLTPWTLVREPYPHIMTADGHRLCIETDGAPDAERDGAIGDRIVRAVNGTQP